MNQYPFQVEGTEFLRHKKYAVLADEMGLGKSNQAILGLDSIHAKNVLVVCPAVAKINWEREFKLWSRVPRNITILQKISDFPTINGINICSFDWATANTAKLSALSIDSIIVDEAHFLKNATSKRTKAILGRNGLIHCAKKSFWLLTGTPAPNHVGELWVYLYTFGATTLSMDSFIKRYCVTFPTSYGLKVVGNNSANIPELKTLLKKVMLRRLKKDVMPELPEIFYDYTTVQPGKVDVEMMPSFADYFWPHDRKQELQDNLNKQAKLLSDVFYSMKKKNNDALNAIGAISDSVSTLRRYVGLQKVEPTIKNVVHSFKSGVWDKLVIFAIHADVINQLRDGFAAAGLKPVTLYGKTPPKKRQRNIDNFQNNPKCKIFIGNIMAAGTAINLTVAHTVLFVEQDWVPGNNAQAVMRVHRIGQDKRVTVRMVTLKDSIDGHIAHIITKKIRQLTELFDD